MCIPGSEPPSVAPRFHSRTNPASRGIRRDAAAGQWSCRRRKQELSRRRLRQRESRAPAVNHKSCHCIPAPAYRLEWTSRGGDLCFAIHARCGIGRRESYILVLGRKADHIVTHRAAVDVRNGDLQRESERLPDRRSLRRALAGDDTRSGENPGVVGVVAISRRGNRYAAKEVRLPQSPTLCSGQNPPPLPSPLREPESGRAWHSGAESAPPSPPR